MSSSPPRSFSLAVFILWGFAGSLAYLPLFLVSLISTLALAAWRLFRQDNQHILFININKIWGLPRRSSFAQRFAHQVMTSQFEVFFDTLRGIFRPHTLSIAGFEEFQQRLTAGEAYGRGQILVTAHLGSWELAGKYSAQAGNKPFFALAKAPPQRIFRQLMEKLRRHLEVRILWTDNHKRLTRTMVKLLHQGANLGFVMDQKPAGRQGPVVDFFGHPTPFVAGPAAMAHHRDCPIISVFCLRVGSGSFRLISTTLVAAGEARLLSLEEITQRCASEIERVVRLYPEQWNWQYKRWVFL